TLSATAAVIRWSSPLLVTLSVNAGTVLNPVHAFDDDKLTRLKLLADRDVVALRVLQRYGPYLSFIVGSDNIDICPLRPALNRSHGNDRGAVFNVEEQMHVHKLIRIECVVFVVENRLQP